MARIETPSLVYMLCSVPLKPDFHLLAVAFSHCQVTRNPPIYSRVIHQEALPSRVFENCCSFAPKQ